MKKIVNKKPLFKPQFLDGSSVWPDNSNSKEGALDLFDIINFSHEELIDTAFRHDLTKEQKLYIKLILSQRLQERDSYRDLVINWRR